jgi:aminoglycoside phosphotransferase (APT) family kinase protein
MQTSLDLSRATEREPLGPTAEGLSSATFERVVLDGQRCVVKRLSFATDWVMRFVQDSGVPRVIRLHASGWLDRLPEVLDTTLVDVAFDPDTGVAELLMRDVSGAFLRDSDPITAEQNHTLLDAMAQLHASTRTWVDDLGLTPPSVRWRILSPANARSEALRAPLTGVPAALEPMWARLAQSAPSTHRMLTELLEDPTPLVDALSATPSALVHGDWKGGNLGITEEGRVVLVDWAFPGIDAPCADLGWYLAVNCDRLPEDKDAAAERYREALERHGFSSAGWWGRQFPLAMLGTAMQMAWSKADQPDELAWWSAKVAEAAALL